MKPITANEFERISEATVASHQADWPLNNAIDLQRISEAIGASQNRSI
ncbi:hypothetical protein [Gimesia aquarii]|nr:hypothetical protein [Gimesia aquarii]